MRDNSKHTGELGERIAIGELAKFNIEVMLPMGDNLPFDLVIFHENQFYKCQVKTSTRTSSNTEGSIFFGLVTTNWHKKESRHYDKSEVDIFILCDLEKIYLFKFNELEGRRSISIRTKPPKNNQIQGITLAKDVIVSEERLNYVLTL